MYLLDKGLPGGSWDVTERLIGGDWQSKPKGWATGTAGQPARGPDVLVNPTRGGGVPQPGGRGPDQVVVGRGPSPGQMAAAAASGGGDWDRPPDIVDAGDASGAPAPVVVSPGASGTYPAPPPKKPPPKKRPATSPARSAQPDSFGSSSAWLLLGLLALAAL